MNAIVHRFLGNSALMVLTLLLPSARCFAQPLAAFGLTHAPLGDASVSFESGRLVVTGNGGSSGGFGEVGHYGVSVQLGEADSGVFIYPYSDLYTLPEASFMVGQAFGQVDGVKEELICVLRASRAREGAFEIEADFTSLGSATLLFEVFLGDTFIGSATNQGGSAVLYTYGQSGPRANPFWRTRDGGVAAIIELSEQAPFGLPGSEQYQYTYGDRLVIRPVDPVSTVDFVSTVEVTAGGGLNQFFVTDERPGVFRRPHKALGTGTLLAAQGTLTVGNASAAGADSEAGVFVELDRVERFQIGLAPVDLGVNGASMLASAIALVNGVEGEFVGYAGVRNTNGARQLFASVPAFGPEVQVAVYSNGCLVGTSLVPSVMTALGVSGAPQIVGFTASANSAHTRPGIFILLDRLTAFSLATGSVVEGNEVRFQAVNPVSIEHFTGFSLSAVAVASFTIASETDPRTITVADYLTDVVPGASLKGFDEQRDGSTEHFTRRVSQTNRQDSPLILLTDTNTNGSKRAAYYSFQSGDFYFHGLTDATFDAFSVDGLRQFPAQMLLGQNYTGYGTFDEKDLMTGSNSTATVSTSTRAAAFEMVTVPAGTFPAVRMESVATITSLATNRPVARRSTHWLAAGIGLIRYTEVEQFPDDSTRHRSGELTDFAMVTRPVPDATANVGANIVLSLVTTNSPDAALTLQWRKNGINIPDATNAYYTITNLQIGDAGQYSVELGTLAGVLTPMPASVRVIPFSDTPDFWARSVGGTNHDNGGSVAVDTAGNVYMTGGFLVSTTIGTNTLASTSGNWGSFLAKADAAGNFLWAISLDGDAKRVEVDPAGNACVAGTFTGTAHFGTNVVMSEGGSEMFVAKVAPNGTFLWVAHSSGMAAKLLEALDVDANGNLYVAGGFYGGSAIFGSIALSNAPNAYETSAYVTKLDASGHFVWALSAHGSALYSYVLAKSLVVDSAANVLVGGQFTDSFSIGAITAAARRARYGGFVATIDANGNVLRAEVLGTDVSRVALDSFDNLYVLGRFEVLVSFGNLSVSHAANSYDRVYLVKLAADGRFLWVRKPTGTDLTAMTVDGPGNVYLAGDFYDRATVNGTTFQAETVFRDPLITKFNPDGQLLWVRQAGVTSSSQITDMAVDAARSLYLAGSFYGQSRFGEITLTGPGGNYYSQAFLVKMGGAVPPSITTQPQSQTVNAGGSVTFSVVATGTPELTYQWRKNGVNLTAATNAAYTFSNAQPAEAGDYTVSVGNLGGSVLSAAAKLSVSAPPGGALAFSATNYSVTESNTFATITVVRSGPLDGSVTVDFVAMDGTARAETDYVPTARTLRFAEGEALKTVIIPILDDVLFEEDETILLQLCNATPGITLNDPVAATLTIVNNEPPSPVLLIQPQDHRVVAGSSVQFAVTATGQAPLHYQWRKNGVDIAGAVQAAYSIASVQSGDGGDYSVVVGNVAGSVTSRNANLTIHIPPTIIAHPQSQLVLVGNPVTLQVTASTIYDPASLRYQWRLNGKNIAGATNATYAMALAQFSNAGSYVAVVSDPFSAVTSQPAVLDVRLGTGEELVVFGLTNVALGNAAIALNGSDLVVTSDGSGAHGNLPAPQSSSPDVNDIYGVSVRLGEADSGVFIHLYTSYSYIDVGNRLTARTYGTRQGQGNQLLSTVRGRKVDYDTYSVEADFTEAGSGGLIFEAYAGERLVARSMGRNGSALRLNAYDNAGPYVNPAWRNAEGHVVALIQLGGTYGLSLPGAGAYGDRVVIRPVNAPSQPQNVSHVDVTGGGGFDQFLITLERLGMFQHPHRSISGSLLQASGGRLTVSRPLLGEMSESGVAVDVDERTRFEVTIEPLTLGTNAMLAASALGTRREMPGEFFGQAGVRDHNGFLQVFASLLSLETSLQIEVYQDGAFVGRRLSPSATPVVPLAGRPRIVGFQIAASTAQSNERIAISFDVPTAFSLPDGSVLEGNQIRLQAANPAGFQALSGFSLVASNLASFTITSETGPEIIHLADYVQDMVPGASAKRFAGASHGQAVTFTRTPSLANRDGQSLLQITDTFSTSNSRSQFHRFQGEDLYYHGYSTPERAEFSSDGLRLFPGELRLGQVYTNTARFIEFDPAFASPYVAVVNVATRAAALGTITVPAGTFLAVRLESVATLSYLDSSGPPAPAVRRSTNWLASGIGVVRFAEVEETPGQAAQFRSGELTDFLVLQTPPRDATANVGANLVLNVSMAYNSGPTYRWQHDGADVLSGSDATLILRRLSVDHQGPYTVAVQNGAGAILSEPAFVRVIPFSDTADFWATTYATNQTYLDGRDTAVDGSGNVYVTGAFEGVARFGTHVLISQGSSDAFMAKTDAQGHVLWARRAGGISYGDGGLALGTDAAGNVYVAGLFRGTADFGPHTLTSRGEGDLFVTKLDPAGNFLWAISGGNDSTDFAPDLAVDDSGNVYLSGVIGYGPSPAQFGSFTVTNAGYQTLFLAKLDANGSVLWAVQNGGDAASAATSRGLAVGPSGDVYLTGTAYSTISLGGTVLALPQNTAAAFVSKLSGSGQFLWTRKLGQNSYSHDLGVDGVGNVYVYGAFSGAANFSGIVLQSTPPGYSSQGAAGYYENFLAKLDADSGFLWVRKGLGPAVYDSGSLAVDRAGNAYVAMTFYNRLSVGGTTFEAFAYPDISLAKVDAYGRLIWAKQVGGDNLDAVSSIETDASGNVYLSGSFQKETLFGDTPLLGTTDPGTSLFLVKMGAATAPTITQQPQTQTVNAGDAITFTVQANGTAPFSYQWQKDGTDIPGATGNSYVIARVQGADEADYAVVVHNLGGIASSVPARLTVVTPPSITINGTSDGRIQISWKPAQFTLEYAHDVKGPWTLLNTSTNSVTLPAADGTQFYRARRP